MSRRFPAPFQLGVLDLQLMTITMSMACSNEAAEGGLMEYRPEDEAGVQEINDAATDEETREREAKLLEESDNSPQSDDPQEQGDA